MSRIETRKTVARIIMNINRPFSVFRLYDDCKNNGIDSKDLVLDVLESLCDSGMVQYVEITDNCWAYVPCA